MPEMLSGGSINAASSASRAVVPRYAQALGGRAPLHFAINYNTHDVMGGCPGMPRMLLGGSFNAESGASRAAVPK